MLRNRLREKLEKREQAKKEPAVNDGKFVMPIYESIGCLHDEGLLVLTPRISVEKGTVITILNKLLTTKMLADTREAITHLLQNMDGYIHVAYTAMFNCAIIALGTDHTLHRRLGEFAFVYNNTSAPDTFAQIGKQYHELLHVCPGQGFYHPFMYVLYRYMEIPLNDLYKSYNREITKYNKTKSYPDITHLLCTGCPTAQPATLVCRADLADQRYYLHASAKSYDMDNAHEVLFTHLPATVAAYNHLDKFNDHPYLQALIMSAVRHHGLHLVLSLT